MIRILLTMLVFLALPAMAADDLKVSVLEQDVRDLKRQVQALSRQVDELRNRPGDSTPRAAPQRESTSSDELPQWVDAAKWRLLRRGMSELEVIGSLGSPTSMRDEAGARVLLYAMEIGASGFLGGSVTLRERAVTEIRQPTLQ